MSLPQITHIETSWHFCKKAQYGTCFSSKLILLIKNVHFSENISFLVYLTFTSISLFFCGFSSKAMNTAFVALHHILAPVVQKVDRINLYQVDRATGFPNTYPLDRTFSGPSCSKGG